MLGLSIFYLTIVSLACIAAIRLALKVIKLAVAIETDSKSRKAEKWNVFSYWVLFIYFASNFIVEITAWYWYFNYPGMNNSPIYAVCLIISALTILVFFGIQSRSKIVGILFFIFFSVLLIAYFKEEQWKPDSHTSFIFGLFNFSFLAIASAIFIAGNLRRTNGKPNKFKIRFGVVYFVNCFLSLFISAFTFEHSVYELDPYLIFQTNYILSTSFYALCALLLWYAANDELRIFDFQH